MTVRKMSISRFYFTLLMSILYIVFLGVWIANIPIFSSLGGNAAFGILIGNLSLTIGWSLLRDMVIGVIGAVSMIFLEPLRHGTDPAIVSTLLSGPLFVCVTALVMCVNIDLRRRMGRDTATSSATVSSSAPVPQGDNQSPS